MQLQWDKRLQFTTCVIVFSILQVIQTSEGIFTQTSEKSSFLKETKSIQHDVLAPQDENIPANFSHKYTSFTYYAREVIYEFIYTETYIENANQVINTCSLHYSSFNHQPIIHIPVT